MSHYQRSKQEWDDDGNPIPSRAAEPAPKDVENGFVVEIRCHTKEALHAITSPEALRFQIGHMLDSWKLQEEVDYTLNVERLRQ